MTVLVTGASGPLGRLVVEHLLSRGAIEIIATTRTPDRLADLAARGVDVRLADFDDRRSLPAAFAGAERALIVSTDAVDDTGRRQQQHLAAVEAATAAGVGHLLYTSMVNARPANPAAVVPDHIATEDALAASGARWTSLRNNVYAEAALGVLAPALASGTLHSAAGDGAIGYVTRDDCARVAAAALLAADLAEGTVDVTGPAAITHTQLAAIASDVIGRPVAYVPVDADTAVAGMVGAGIPEPVAHLIVSFDLATAAGEFAVVSSTVADLTGEPPVPLDQFLRSHKASFDRP